jgi:hypothetical protein
VERAGVDNDEKFGMSFCAHHSLQKASSQTRYIAGH